MISRAEVALGVRFPAQYRGFLHRYGATNGAGFYLAGCFKVAGHPSDPPLWCDVVSATLQLRRTGTIPHEHVLISDNGADHKYFLCTSPTAEAPEGAVVVLGPGADNSLAAGSFDAFVGQLLNGEAPFNE